MLGGSVVEGCHLGEASHNRFFVVEPCSFGRLIVVGRQRSGGDSLGACLGFVVE